MEFLEGFKNIFSSTIDIADKAAGSNLAQLYVSHQDNKDAVNLLEAETEAARRMLIASHDQIDVNGSEVIESGSQKGFDMNTLTPYWPALVGIISIPLIIMAIRR